MSAREADQDERLERLAAEYAKSIYDNFGNASVKRDYKAGYRAALESEDNVSMDYFLAESDKLRAIIKQKDEEVRGLREALEHIASHGYAGIAHADAKVTIARESLARFRGESNGT